MSQASHSRSRQPRGSEVREDLGREQGLAPQRAGARPGRDGQGCREGGARRDGLLPRDHRATGEQPGLPLRGLPDWRGAGPARRGAPRAARPRRGQHRAPVREELLRPGECGRGGGRADHADREVLGRLAAAKRNCKSPPFRHS